ncbi:MAG: hypothetical protein M3460_17280 [Actinomycetota bacterium]|nr:hypothetical protein [Actinomycetota bacterium]
MSTPVLSMPAVVNPSAGVAGEAARLARDAAAAAQVRTWRMHPDVVALRVERIRAQVDRLMWAGIAAGLCFTMTNVQQFAAAGAAAWSLAWLAAWLLDLMVSMVLLAVLRAEQVTTRYQVSTSIWPRVTKWALLSATYVMNTWTSWAAGSASGVVLHSVPPLVVVLAAEAVTDLQYALTECVHRAHAAATARAAESGPQPIQPVVAVVSESPRTSGPPPPATAATAGEHLAGASREHLTGSAGERLARGVNPPARAVTKRVTEAAGASRRAAQGRRSAPVRRRLLADYVAEARAAWTPGVVVSPAWVRQVTDCSRGLSSKVAATLTTDPTLNHPIATASEPEGRAA